MPPMQQRIAVKALIVDADGRVLCLRKSHDDERHAGQSGRYNLPGGKVTVGETVGAALIREVHEETGISLARVARTPVFVGEWRPVVRGTPHQIIGLFFVCDIWRGAVMLDSEHDEYVWLTPESFPQYDILPPEDEALSTYFAGLQRK